MPQISDLYIYEFIDLYSRANNHPYNHVYLDLVLACHIQIIFSFSLVEELQMTANRIISFSYILGEPIIIQMYQASKRSQVY